MKYFRSTAEASRRGARAALFAALLTSALPLAAPARPQESEAYLDASYIRSRPPPGVDTEPGNYVAVGLTVRGASPRLYGSLRALGGLDMSVNAPDWAELSASAGAEGLLGDRVAVGLGASGFALAYSGPSRYRAIAGTLQPSIRVGVGRVGVMGQVRGWLGRTSVLNPVGGALGGVAGEARKDLELVETGLDLWIVSGPASLGIGADLSRTRGATYRTGRAWASARPTERLVLSGSVLTRGGENETEAAFVAAASYQVDPTVQLEATLSRTLPDLLLGSEPTVAAALTVRFRLGDRARRAGTARSRETAVAEVVEVAEVVKGADAPAGHRIVRFRVSVPADSVALVGDFTGWEQRRMRHVSGSTWVVEQALEPGVYRYAFIVDGAWWVPERGRGLVDDGFGQKNLVLVVSTE